MQTFTAFATVEDAQDREFEIECKVYPGSAATREDPEDPGEVEIVSVRLNGDKVNGKAVDDLLDANHDYILEQAWDYFYESQDDYDDSGEDFGYDDRDGWEAWD